MLRHVLALSLLLPAIAAAQPAGHVTLDDLVRELSRDPRAPAAVDALLAGMGTRPGAGAMLSADQQARLRAKLLEALRTGDADALERAPALTVAEMGAAVTVLNAASAANPGQPAAAPAAPTAQGRMVAEPLGIPVKEAPAAGLGAPPAPASQPGPLGALGIVKRDVPDPDLSSRAADSARMADVLNRLAVNPPEAPRTLIVHRGRRATRVTGLLSALMTMGHTLEVRDVRTFADFAGLTSNGRDLAASMWADTELPVPGRGTLKVPVTHSQHELVVRGPDVNVDIAFFMGIDGVARFRPMTDARAGWTGRRVARVYEGAEAIRAMRVAAEVRRAFEEKRAANPQLPYGGYFTLGVCNDSNAFVEYAMTGRTTLYPLTRDLAYYQGPGEIDRISRAMPVDGRGAPADLERVLASLPVDDPEELVFDELKADLRALRAASAGQTGAPAPTQGLQGELERATGQ